MSRLGPWAPTTVEERLDRMESLVAIRQLPSRYALALDSRDMAAMAGLCLPDVRAGTEAGHARGVVYCRDPLDRPDTGRWEIGDLQYWDAYERVDGLTAVGLTAVGQPAVGLTAVGQG